MTMTPQERQLIDDLFDRLAKLESAPRDAQADRAIAEAAQRAPHALYALVQTVLVQDEALKQAEARIREYEGGAEPQQGGGFLDTMRNAMSGRGSVPSVRAGTTPDSRWNTGGALAQSQPASPFNAQPQQQQGGPSFLGTAAATAAGVIGGSMLFNALGGMFGSQNSAQAATPQGGDDAAGSGLSRDAGANDVSGHDNRAGLFDDGDQFDTADNGDFGGDFGGDL
jgi:hypothetical protein